MASLSRNGLGQKPPESPVSGKTPKATESVVLDWQGEAGKSGDAKQQIGLS
jgi:hypothetical protein